MKSIALPVVCAAALFALSANAQVVVKDAWVRATVPQQHASGAFLQITSAQPAQLVQASSKVADVVEIHEMKMNGNVMEMKAVPALELPAGKTVTLEPGGYHIMMMGLKHQLKAGDTVPLTLTVENADHSRDTVEVEAAVRPLGAKAGMKMH